MGTLDVTPQGDRHSVVEILDRTCAAAERDTTSVRRTVESLGHVSHGALVLLPAILIVTPLSGIPGLPTVAGLIIGLISLQSVLGRDRLWLPEWVLRRQVDTTRLEKAIGFLRGPARFVDRHTRRRLSFLVSPPARTALKLACMVCGFAMPFLELVPFSSSIVAAAITFFATALVARDGLLAAIGLVFVAATIVVVVLTIF